MIHILTPTLGNPSAHYTLSLLRAALDLGRVRIKYSVGMVVGVSPTEIARNEAVAMFLDGDATHLMFIDDDMVFAASDIVALHQADKPIVGGVVPKRLGGYAVAPMKDPVSEEDHLVGVDSVGTGFMMIKREVILAMINGEPVRANGNDRWPIFQCGVNVDRGEYLSEDYAFCLRAKTLGFQSWVHTGLRIGHVGRQVFYGGDEEHRRAAALPRTDDFANRVGGAA